MGQVREIEVLPLSNLCNGGFKGHIVDVRTPAEYAEVRANVKICNVPLDAISEELMSKMGMSDKNAEIYVICRSGARSMKACEILSQLGFVNLTNVTGGTMAWAQQGLPVTKG